MDALLEEVVGNKIELAGPLIDFYLRQIGQVMKNKLCRSKATGLVNAFTIAIRWSIFRHILVLVRGYGGDVQTKQKGRAIKHYVTIQSIETAEKLFSPARFSGGKCVGLQTLQESAINHTWRETTVCLWWSFHCCYHSDNPSLSGLQYVKRGCYCFFVCATLHER